MHNLIAFTQFVYGAQRNFVVPDLPVRQLCFDQRAKRTGSQHAVLRFIGFRRLMHVIRRVEGRTENLSVCTQKQPAQAERIAEMDDVLSDYGRSGDERVADKRIEQARLTLAVRLHIKKKPP